MLEMENFGGLQILVKYQLTGTLINLGTYRRSYLILKYRQNCGYFYKVSQLAPVSIQINKGLAGASKQAIQLTKQTSMHPGVYDAGALAIMSYSTDKPQFGKPKMTPEIKQKVDYIYKAMNMIIALAPDAGTYANEADYFQKLAASILG